MDHLPLTQLACPTPRAFEIASNSLVTVYDAIYLALSEKENCPLVTADLKLAKNAPGYQIIPLNAL